MNISSNPLFRVGALLFGAVVLFAAAGFVWPLLLLPSYYVLPGSEGIEAGLISRLVAGLPLYPAPDVLVAAPETPLYFLLLSLTQKTGQALFLITRNVSLFSFLASASLVFALARRFNINRLAAAAASLFLIAIFTRFFPGFIIAGAPQWLGTVFMLAGLCTLLRYTGKLPTFIAFALMALAILIKHNIFAIPLAALIWLYQTDRPRFFFALITGTILAAGSALALHLAFGMNFWANLLTPVSFSFDDFLGQQANLLAAAAGVCIWLTARFTWRNAVPGNAAKLIDALLICGLIEFIIRTLRGDLAQGAIADLIIGASAGFALLADYVLLQKDEEKQGKFMIVLASILFIPLLLWPNYTYLGPAIGGEAGEAFLDRLEKMEATVLRLEKVPQESWCEEAGYCTLAGRPFDFDYRTVAARMAAGMLNADTLRTEFLNRKMRGMQLNDPAATLAKPESWGKTALSPLLYRMRRDITPPGAPVALFER